MFVSRVHMEMAMFLSFLFFLNFIFQLKFGYIPFKIRIIREDFSLVII